MAMAAPFTRTVSASRSNGSRLGRARLQFLGADLPIVIRVERDERFDVGAGEDHLRFEAIGEDLQRGRAQAGIVGVREAGDANEKRCQPAASSTDFSCAINSCEP